MRIEVTASDIANGRRGDECFCPIALAIKRHTEMACEVTASQARLSDRRGKVCVFEMPAVAVIFVANYDRGEDLSSWAPFSFELDPSKNMVALEDPVEANV